MGILRDTMDGDGLGAGLAPDAQPTQRFAAVTTSAPTDGGPTDARTGAPASTAPPVPSPQHAELERQRDALTQQVIEMHWDLGGLAYEMAIRDHFRLDVLVRRAAVLQERDAELAEVERLLRMEQDGVAGKCPVCQAPHSRGALFCSQCGGTLIERLPSSAASVGE